MPQSTAFWCRSISLLGLVRYRTNGAIPPLLVFEGVQWHDASRPTLQRRMHPCFCPERRYRWRPSKRAGEAIVSRRGQATQPFRSSISKGRNREQRKWSRSGPFRASFCKFIVALAPTRDPGSTAYVYLDGRLPRSLGPFNAGCRGQTVTAIVSGVVVFWDSMRKIFKIFFAVWVRPCVLPIPAVEAVPAGPVLPKFCMFISDTISPSNVVLVAGRPLARSGRNIPAGAHFVLPFPLRLGPPLAAGRWPCCSFITHLSTPPRDPILPLFSVHLSLELFPTLICDWDSILQRVLTPYHILLERVRRPPANHLIYLQHTNR